MSTDDPQIPKRSFKDRVKLYLPAATIGLVVGVIATKSFRSTPINITLFENETGSVLLSPSVVEQVKKIGSALIELTPGYFVDIIDWGHPEMANK